MNLSVHASFVPKLVLKRIICSNAATRNANNSFRDVNADCDIPGRCRYETRGVRVTMVRRNSPSEYKCS